MGYSLPELREKDTLALEKALEAVRLAQPKKVNYYDRNRGLKVIIKHIETALPDLAAGGKTVLDVGPGVGFFIEVAIAMGNAVVGIDAIASNRAQTAYKNVTKALGLEVHYVGFHRFIDGEQFIYMPGVFDLIHFRGSLDAVLLASTPPLSRQSRALLELCGKALKPGGRVEVFHNLTSDLPQIRAALRECAAAQADMWQYTEDSDAHSRIKRAA